MLTLSQIGWACQHDWFCCVTPDGKGVVVVENFHSSHASETKTFYDFQALRAWAGY
jgi:hypothetical protein